jgi:DnaJ-class molecular chaperone
VGIAVALIAIGGGGWLVSLWLWPYKTCSWCDGTGRSPGSNSRRHGLCWRCKGSPRKLRRGARMVKRGLDK